MRWPNHLSAEMVSAALLKPERMRTLDLFQYIQHLQSNAQAAQRYEIEFWKKVFYPLSCLVMVVLALPFAYLHFRSGSITTYVFGGVLAGISFFLLNNVFGYIGNAAKLAALAGCRVAGHDLFGVVAVGFWLAGAQAMRRTPLFRVNPIIERARFYAGNHTFRPWLA